MKQKQSRTEKKKASNTAPTARSVRWASVKAIALFALYALVLFGLIYTPFAKRVAVDPLTDFVARSAGWLFHLFGADVSGAGTTVTVNGVSLSIAFGCNGVEALAIYIAALLAAPFSWRSKGWGLLVGIVGNFIINQIRVMGLFLAAMIGPQEFEYAHKIVGQTFVIVLSMGLFLWWGSRYGQGGKAKTKPVLA